MPNRFICNVLEEMRKCTTTGNYSNLLSLIEEAQTFANRMEAGLRNVKDLKQLDDERHELKQEVKVFRKAKLKVIKELGITHSELKDVISWEDQVKTQDIINILLQRSSDENQI